MTWEESDEIRRRAQRKADTDRKHVRSLIECGIPLALNDPKSPDDLLVVVGKLGHIEIRHSHNYYWMANGNVPINTALELYNTPLGKRAIRVAGHCGCPAPDHPWTDLVTPDGKIILKAAEEADFKRLKLSTSEFVFSDTYVQGEQTVVKNYHIDSDAALLLFVMTLRKNGVVP